MDTREEFTMDINTGIKRMFDLQVGRKLTPYIEPLYNKDEHCVVMYSKLDGRLSLDEPYGKAVGKFYADGRCWVRFDYSYYKGGFYRELERLVYDHYDGSITNDFTFNGRRKPVYLPILKMGRWNTSFAQLLNNQWGVVSR